ncbi:gamma carbonic anhydrase family protein [Oceanirhabdus sp. W0125-5]|uniref:gamma carbonic anhydrase family protein n=1 Tax=Oceanirhabdus sp. W0125-5 TaxID=2999116 RepID=UPI0022F32F33|nr:gamma carbonic anhydrase family protein [Oceanirhabdus sp. W0125-5]WBW98721.1 gamma carbonic anhydrase family protein [Oceanirhabdus sp. W0125-5]
MIKEYFNKKPFIEEGVFYAENATLIGEVILEKDSSVWFNTVLRADNELIKIGEGTNIQDNCTVHVDEGFPVEIGKGVTVGHNVILHGCKVGDNSLIGMGSILLDGVEIGENTIIGAGSLVTSGKKIPSGVLCLGSPAKVIRELTQEEIKSIGHSSNHYVAKSKEYLK